jgi:hypothetical protein
MAICDILCGFATPLSRNCTAIRENTIDKIIIAQCTSVDFDLTDMEIWAEKINDGEIFAIQIVGQSNTEYESINSRLCVPEENKIRKVSIDFEYFRDNLSNQDQENLEKVWISASNYRFGVQMCNGAFYGFYKGAFDTYRNFGEKLTTRKGRLAYYENIQKNIVFLSNSVLNLL